MRRGAGREVQAGMAQGVIRGSWGEVREPKDAAGEAPAAPRRPRLVGAALSG
jgi:hypothetical protein